MTANETKLQNIIEGVKQFVVPLFQRPYTWELRHWQTLWNDLVDLCETENPKSHFLGSIVNMPTVSVPEGVAKYLLIDGQQRITTIFILLSVLRDYAKEIQETELADEIHHTYIVNPFKKGIDHFKLIPTQTSGDRENFCNLLLQKPFNTESKIGLAYQYFEKKLKQKKLDIQHLKKIITSYISIVSITLDPDDNPHLVFESLNYKGEPLSPADLIRNYFFMRIHVDKQDEIYQEFWQPMQETLSENLTEFIRHFLMKEGTFVKQSDIYVTLKNKITPSNSIEKLQELYRFSNYYGRFLKPINEPDVDIQKKLKRLNRLDVTTSFPMLLNFYDLYSNIKQITKTELIEILNILENFLIRRFICNIPTNQLNKIFPAVFNQVIQKSTGDIVAGFKAILLTKGYPKDTEFIDNFIRGKFYGVGNLNSKTKLILESIEQHFNHKEEVNFETSELTIEHIMPQTLTQIWQIELGEDWQITHELYLHNIGNLTITGYNSELSNSIFSTKKEMLEESHLQINKYFQNVNSWNKEAIEIRANFLAKKAISIWNYFGTTIVPIESSNDVTGTVPTGLWILGQYFQVQSWRDVLQETLNTISDLEPEKFQSILENYPRFVNKDKTKFASSRQLKNGYFIETRLSAKVIQNFCYQAIESIELSSDEWKVSTIIYEGNG